MGASGSTPEVPKIYKTTSFSNYKPDPESCPNDNSDEQSSFDKLSQITTSLMEFCSFYDTISDIRSPKDAFYYLCQHHFPQFWEKDINDIFSGIIDEYNSIINNPIDIRSNTEVMQSYLKTKVFDMRDKRKHNLVEMFIEISKDLNRPVSCLPNQLPYPINNSNDISHIINISTMNDNLSIFPSFFTSTNDYLWMSPGSGTLLKINENEECAMISIPQKFGKQPPIIGVDNSLIICSGKQAAVLSNNDEFVELKVNGGSLIPPFASDGCNIYSLQSAKEIKVFHVGETEINLVRTINLSKALTKEEIKNASIITNGSVIQIIIPPKLTEKSTNDKITHRIYIFNVSTGDFIAETSVESDRTINGATINFTMKSINILEQHEIGFSKIKVIPYEGPDPAGVTGIDFRDTSYQSLVEIDNYLQRYMGTGVDAEEIECGESTGASDLCKVITSALKDKTLEDKAKEGLLRTGLSIIAGIAHAHKLRKGNVRPVYELIMQVEQESCFQRALYAAVESFPEFCRMSPEEQNLDLTLLINKCNKQQRAYVCRELRSSKYLYMAIQHSSLMSMLDNLENNYDIVDSYLKRIFMQIFSSDNTEKDIQIFRDIYFHLIDVIKSNADIFNDKENCYHKLLMLTMDLIPYGMKTDLFVDQYITILHTIIEAVSTITAKGVKISKGFLVELISSIYCLTERKPSQEVMNIAISALSILTEDEDILAEFLHLMMKNTVIGDLLKEIKDNTKIVEAFSSLKDPRFQTIRFLGMLLFSSEEATPQNEDEKMISIVHSIINKSKPSFEIAPNTLFNQYALIKLQIIEAKKELITPEIFQTMGSYPLIIEVVKSLPSEEKMDIFITLLKSIGSIIKAEHSDLAKPATEKTIDSCLVINNAIAAVLKLIEVDPFLQGLVYEILNGFADDDNSSAICGLAISISTVFDDAPTKIHFNMETIKDMDPFIKILEYTANPSTPYSIKNLCLALCLANVIELPCFIDKVEMKNLYKWSVVGIRSPIEASKEVKNWIKDGKEYSSYVSAVQTYVMDYIITKIFAKKVLNGGLDNVEWTNESMKFAVSFILAIASELELISFDIPDGETPIDLNRNIFEDERIGCQDHSLADQFHSTRLVYKYLIENKPGEFANQLTQIADELFNKPVDSEMTKECFKIATIWKYMVLLSTKLGNSVKIAALKHLFTSIEKNSPFFKKHEQILLWHALTKIESSESFAELISSFETDDPNLRAHIELQKIRINKNENEFPQSTLESDSIIKIMAALLPPSYPGDEKVLEELLKYDWAKIVAKHQKAVIAQSDSYGTLKHISFPLFVPEKVYINGFVKHVFCNGVEITKNEDGTYSIPGKSLDVASSVDFTVSMTGEDDIARIARECKARLHQEIQMWRNISIENDQIILKKNEVDRITNIYSPFFIELRSKYLNEFESLTAKSPINGPFARFKAIDDFSESFTVRITRTINVAVERRFMDGFTDDVGKSILAQVLNYSTYYKHDFIAIGAESPFKFDEFIANEICSERLGLFVRNPEGLLMPNPNVDHMKKNLFKSVGLIWDHTKGIPFAPAVFKFLAGRPLGVEDISFMKSQNDDDLLSVETELLSLIRDGIHNFKPTPFESLVYLNQKNYE